MVSQILLLLRCMSEETGHDTYDLGRHIMVYTFKRMQFAKVTATAKVKAVTDDSSKFSDMIVNSIVSRRTV